MIKRLAKVLFFTPVLFLEGAFILYNIVKWLFTGKKISNYSPLFEFVDW